MAPPRVSLIALPGASPEALPLILLQQDDVWLEMTPPLDPRAGVSAAIVRQRINLLLVEMLHQLRSGQTVSRVRLRADCQDLYEALVPDALHLFFQDTLAAASPAAPLLRIYLHPAVDWVPWELLFDETDFLGLRFCLARLPILTRRRASPAPGPRLVRCVASLLGKDVFDPPLAPRLLPLWEQTFTSQLSPSARELRFPTSPNGSQPAYPTLDQLEQAARECDILHLTCHGGLLDAEGQQYWTLDHRSSQTFDYRITASVVDNLPLSGNPLVFGNACASGIPGESQAGLTLGFGARFFARGALSFIGSLASITQDMGVRFARQFYTYLLQPDGQPGLTVAQALSKTKQFFHARNDPDPSYLFYCLYGSADSTFVMTLES